MNKFLNKLNYQYTILDDVYFLDSRDKQSFDDFKNWNDYQGCIGYYVIPIENGYASLDVTNDEFTSFYREFSQLKNAVL